MSAAPANPKLSKPFARPTRCGQHCAQSSAVRRLATMACTGSSRLSNSGSIHSLSQQEHVPSRGNCWSDGKQGACTNQQPNQTRAYVRKALKSRTRRLLRDTVQGRQSKTHRRVSWTGSSSRIREIADGEFAWQLAPAKLPSSGAAVSL